MAYMSQEKKAKIAPVVKALLKQYNIKGSLSVSNHSTLVLTIKQGAVDFIENFNAKIDTMPGYDSCKEQSATRTAIDVNPYHFKDQFTGVARTFLIKLFDALNDGNHDRSDSMTDYFDVGWYLDINIGKWDKPYQLIK